MKVFLNGEILPASKAAIPVDDRAVLYGDSIFETVRAYSGKPFRLSKHIARLEKACAFFRLKCPFNRSEIERAVELTIRANDLDQQGVDAYVRITLTGGKASGTPDLRREELPNFFIIAREYVPPPQRFYKKGISVIISQIRKNPHSPVPFMKTGNYLDSLIARQEAIERGADDAIFLTTNGFISEATTSNIFMVRGNRLSTPAKRCALLPGITRDVVCEIARGLEIEIDFVVSDLSHLFSADEIFLTNSLVEIVPVTKVEGEIIGKGIPGQITRKLHEAYRDFVSRELKVHL